MISRAKLCASCRAVLEESGYAVTPDKGPEEVDRCEICLKRTGVKPCKITKGEAR